MKYLSFIFPTIYIFIPASDDFVNHTMYNLLYLPEENTVKVCYVYTLLSKINKL